MFVHIHIACVKKDTTVASVKKPRTKIGCVMQQKKERTLSSLLSVIDDGTQVYRDAVLEKHLCDEK